MYDLGEYFIFDSEKALMNPESILKGGKYRITILTDSLIRFEYNESGVFNDMPTEKVLYRNFSKPEFTFREDDKYLEISQRIGKEVLRGVTGIKSKGMYTDKEKLMLMCVAPRNEIAEIRQIVNEIDSKAFIIIEDAREVYGKGFKKQ